MADVLRLAANVRTSPVARNGSDGPWRRWWILGMSIVVMTTGCATVGREFPVAYVDSIEKGTTTQEQIRDRFGAPWRVGLEDGQTTWTYGKYRYSLFGEPSTTDLVVRFDSRGVVASYSYSTTEYEGDPGRSAR